MSEQTGNTGRKRILGLPPNIFFMGLTSLLTDVSSEMVFTLIPIYLTNVLMAPMAIVGVVGGVSEGADSFFRVLSGWFSDRIGKRKILAFFGYAVSTIVKPFLSLASTWGGVLGVRFADRLGKGIRTSSRDALIADSVTPDERGKSFGLHRAMDTTGAFLGLAIAVLVVWLALGADAQQLTSEVFRKLSWVCVIPGVLALVVLQICVHEVKVDKAPEAAMKFPLSGVRKLFSRRFWLFMAIMAVFSLGSMPHNYFCVMRAQDLGAPLIQVLLMVMLFNAVYAVAALPMGILSDKLGRRKVLALGWFVYTLVYLGFAFSTAVWQMWLAFACLGIFFAIIEGVSKAYVADIAPSELRGTAYGVYNSMTGVCVLAGGIIGGVIWDGIGPKATFFFGAGAAFLAMIGILTLIRD
jgi:MFS family permease